MVHGRWHGCRWALAVGLSCLFALWSAASASPRGTSSGVPGSGGYVLYLEQDTYDDCGDVDSSDIDRVTLGGTSTSTKSGMVSSPRTSASGRWLAYSVSSTVRMLDLARPNSRSRFAG